MTRANAIGVNFVDTYPSRRLDRAPLPSGASAAYAEARIGSILPTL